MTVMIFPDDHIERLVVPVCRNRREARRAAIESA